MKKTNNTRCAEPCTLWLTGLSGAGKSTLASLAVERLTASGCATALLDGDAVRRTLCKDLGFSESDRRENIRRLGKLAHEAMAAGRVAVVAAISPLRDARRQVRQSLPPGGFIEVFVDSPLAVCESRDPKGLYRKARRGAIAEFTGIDSTYEAPLEPEIHLHTYQATPEQCIDQIFRFLEKRRRSAS